MPIKRYTPSLESIKEEYAREVNRKRRARLRGPRPKSRIPDNSVPWIENPKTVTELWGIAQKVQAVVERLKICLMPEAQLLLTRHVDPFVVDAALDNQDAGVRALGLTLLRDLAEGGNRLADDILLRREIPLELPV